jgi:hypothetical protein
MSETGTYRTDIPAALNNKFQIPEKNRQAAFLFPQFRPILTRCGALQQSARRRNISVIGELAKQGSHWIAA